ncbi:hypothetical protein Ac2012v2_003728 [Leucoagaricus gongylophorus]
MLIRALETESTAYQVGFPPKVKLALRVAYLEEDELPGNTSRDDGVTSERFLTRPAMSLSRSLSLCLSRSFVTTSSCRSSQISAGPSPPRRKGRTPRLDPKTQSLLSPEKLRALVSLYHQSEDCITMENLETCIDDAFSNPRTISNDISQLSLDSMLKQQRAALKISLWNTDPPVSSLGSRSSWSSAISMREAQIVDALCGTETLNRTLPGYGTLMEARKQKYEKLDNGVEWK